MKSIVDKLSSRLEQVENGGGQSGNQGSEVKDHTHKSSEISDRISDTISDDNKTNVATGNAVMNYVGTNTLKLTPNIYNLKDIMICESVVDKPVYIPLCLASTPYFECKCLIRDGGGGEVDNLFSEKAVQTASADVIYSSSQFYPCRIIGYNLRIDETQRGKGTSMYLHFQLIVFTKDSKEIVCLKITHEPGMNFETYYPWDDGNFLITYQEMINDVITAEDIKEEKVVKSCDFYPSVCDKIDLLEKKIAELEKKVSQLTSGSESTE